MHARCASNIRHPNVEQLNQLYLYLNETKMEQIWVDQPHDFYHAVKMGSHSFQGITDSTDGLWPRLAIYSTGVLSNEPVPLLGS